MGDSDVIIQAVKLERAANPAIGRLPDGVAVNRAVIFSG